MSKLKDDKKKSCFVISPIGSLDSDTRKRSNEFIMRRSVMLKFVIWLNLSLILILSLTNLCNAQESIIFNGIPNVRISEGGISRTIDTLSKTDATEYHCIISKNDDNYYWTSRENVELLPIANGSYITFLAINGSGYVRIVNPESKELVSLLSETGKKYDYIEHLLLGLNTFSYYGESKAPIPPKQSD